jgi:hybrid cluster-associated redox disulfide protein
MANKIKKKIAENMKIEEVIKKHPETVEVFAKHGFHCVGCIAASFESIEQGARAHGITTEELIEDLNKAIR